MTMSNLLARFRKDENANVTVEAVILLPILLFMFMAMFVLFDYFRAHSVAGKTAYTIGDMISRETDYITPDYIDGALNLVDLMNETAVDDTSGLRVSVISFDDAENQINLEWSHTNGNGFAPLTDASVNAMRNQIPNMPSGLHMVVVETVTEYDAIFNIGLADTQIETFVTTVPRFAPQLLWQG